MRLKRKLATAGKSLTSSPKLAAATNTTSNLNRELSASDSHIYYQASYSSMNEEDSAVSGATGLINLDGSLNLNMILKGAHAVLLKDNSSKLCELTLNILENLISIDLLPSEDIDRKLELAKDRLTLPNTTRNVYLDDLEKKYAENFYLAADLALRNVKWLGCVHCQSSSKSFLNDQLRGKVKLLLDRLNKKNSKRFKA
jgi:hypothetical protein